jgi:hypothetical protein
MTIAMVSSSAAARLGMARARDRVSLAGTPDGTDKLSFAGWIDGVGAVKAGAATSGDCRGGVIGTGVGAVFARRLPVWVRTFISSRRGSDDGEATLRAHQYTHEIGV